MTSIFVNSNFYSTHIDCNIQVLKQHALFQLLLLTQSSVVVASCGLWGCSFDYSLFHLRAQWPLWLAAMTWLAGTCSGTDPSGSIMAACSLKRSYYNRKDFSNNSTIFFLIIINSVHQSVKLSVVPTSQQCCQYCPPVNKVVTSQQGWQSHPPVSKVVSSTN